MRGDGAVDAVRGNMRVMMVVGEREEGKKEWLVLR